MRNSGKVPAMSPTMGQRSGSMNVTTSRAERKPPTFGTQLRALLYRNLLVKKRRIATTVIELLLPLVFVSILPILNALIPTPRLAEVPGFPTHTLGLWRGYVGKTIAVSPNSSRVQQIMDLVISGLNISGTPYMMFSDDNSSVEAIRADELNFAQVAIYFNSTDPILDNPVYTLRTAYNKTPTAIFQDPTACRGGLTPGDGLDFENCPANEYLYSGFVYMQWLIDNAMIKLKTGLNNFPLPDVSVQMMPIPEFQPALTWLQYMLPIFLPIIFLPVISPLLSMLVVEKEKFIKSSLRMMGMRDSAFWFSWMLIYLVISTIVVFFVSLIFYVSRIVRLASYGVLLLYFLLVIYALLAFIMMMSSLFKNNNAANLVVNLLIVVLGAVFFAISIPRAFGRKVEPWAYWIACISPPTALALGMDQIVYLETQGGADGGTIMHTDFYMVFPLGYTMLMLAVDVVVFLLLALWLDGTFGPGRFGIPYHKCFCFMRSFWSDSGHVDKNYDDVMRDAEAVEDIEPVSPELRGKDIIKVYNMKRQYKTGKMVKAKPGDKDSCFGQAEETMMAVDGVSLDMYEGHITALLGHNGAGKTTLISMITGLEKPSGGTATIMGQDISDTGDSQRIRNMIGLCPQHDILYPDISVWEHLYVVGKLRGVTSDEIDEAIKQTISDCDLGNQVHTFAKDLSGGQKRKLSLGIALMGDPMVLFLDEPTAGMDPYSRRKIWALLQKIRKDRAILLTTHFMDEADILADRKAIMSKGKLRCCGSSLYLKNKFGIGYHLNMVVRSDDDEPAVTQFVKSQIDGATLSRVHGKELAYTLPAGDSERFPDLFAKLEERSGQETQAEKLGVQNYGISMPTLEEVFLKLGEEAQGDEEKLDDVPLDKLLHTDVSGVKMALMNSTSHLMNNMDDGGDDVSVEQNLAAGPLTDAELNEPVDVSRQQFKALMTIQLLIWRREIAVPIIRLLFPIVMLVAGIVMMKLLTDNIPYLDPPVNDFYNWTSYSELSGLYKNNTGVSIDDFLTNLQTNLGVPGLDEVQNSSNLLQQATRFYGYTFDTFSNPATGVSTSLTLMYNQSAVKSLPALMNSLSNALYQLSAASDPDWRISVQSHPLPEFQPKPEFNQRVFNSIRVLALGFGILVGTYGLEIIADREVKTRNQLRVSGLTAKTYWSVMLTLHCSVAGVIALVAVIVVASIGIPEFSPPGATFCVIMAVIFLCPEQLLFSYASSFMFDRAESYIQFAIQGSIWIGTILYFIVSFIEPLQPVLTHVLHYVFMVAVPHYHMYGMLHYIALVYANASQLGLEGDVTWADYFRPENKVLFSFIIVILHLVLWAFVLRICEVTHQGGDVRDAFCGAKNRNAVAASKVNGDVIDNEDADVTDERKRVEQMDAHRTDANAPVAVVTGLRKEFGKRSGRSCDCCGRKNAERIKVAVRNLTFSVQPGEVFGLLGHNGAGKTTCLQTMTAEHEPTKGKITVAGFDVSSSLSEAFLYLGTCPQHDRLWRRLTVREHLEAYAAIGGVPQRHVQKAVDFYLRALKIEEHSEKAAMEISGGTKRKLSFAMAMMGKPRIVLLDEPSTGMDPSSKRFLWDTISATFKGNRGAILTTHYMEEADALCNRVGIMVSGELKCLGPTQHLKERFGEGYMLEVKLCQSKVTDQDTAMFDLDNYVKRHFPQAKQLERFGDRAQYKIPQDGVQSLSQTFGALERGKEEIHIEEYSFSQSTLEQVFIEFAKSEYESQEEIRHSDSNGRSVIV